MRWDKSRMNLHSWTEWGRKVFFVCVLLADCCGHLFQSHHKWALMFHTGFAAEESRFVWEHLVLTDCLFYPPPIQHEKPGTLYCLPWSPDCFYFLHLWLCKLKQLRHSLINQYWFRNVVVFIDYKLYQLLFSAFLYSTENICKAWCWMDWTA